MNEVLENVAVVKMVKIGSSGIKIADGNYSSKYPRSDEFVSEGVPFIRANNFNNKTIVDDELCFITEQKHKTITKGHLKKNDILITTRGNIGNVAIVPERHENSNINAQIVLLRCNKDWNPLYLLYALTSNDVKKQLNELITGTALKQLSVNSLKKIQIPLPNLATQQKIASILDKADELRQYNQQLVEKYDALTQSLFLEMFGDPVLNEKGFELVSIRDLCEEVRYGTSEKASENGKYPYLRMNNISYSGYMDFKDLKYVNLSDKDLPKYLVKRGDVLFNRTNSKELVGKTGLITADDEFVIAGYLIRVRTNKFANPYYIWAHLNSKWAKLTLYNMCKNIVGMANINAQELQEIKILKAPIELQNQFAERVQMIELQKQQAQEALAKSENLFQSLLQRAFKGELV